MRYFCDMSKSCFGSASKYLLGISLLFIGEGELQIIGFIDIRSQCMQVVNQSRHKYIPIPSLCNGLFRVEFNGFVITAECSNKLVDVPPW